MDKKIDEYLNNLWETMQDSKLDNMLRFEGALNMALKLGIISHDKYELWLYRVKSCPDTEHIGGRIWCSYCGDIESVKVE